MKIAFFSLLAAATLVAGTMDAAEPSTAAQTRASRYQREVRAAFAKRSWRVTAEKPGQLEVERLLLRYELVGLGSNDTTYAHLTIRFQPDSATHTVATATAAKYVREYPDSSSVDRLIFPPLALRNREIAQEYRTTLAEAEGQLAAKSPAHPASKAPLQADGKSGRLAMN